MWVDVEISLVLSTMQFVEARDHKKNLKKNQESFNKIVEEAADDLVIWLEQSQDIKARVIPVLV